jgi:signal transduction histidine kinase
LCPSPAAVSLSARHEAWRSRVFEPFFTTHAENNGLGLTLCSRIISQAKGHVQIESLEGVGTLVTFEVPRYYL